MSALDTKLLAVLKRNEVELAAGLLQEGADPNVRDDTEGSAPLLLVLLGWRANPNMRVWYQAYLQAQRSRDAIALLLESGADVNRTVPDGTTALMMAAGLDDRNLVQSLLDRGADVNSRTVEGGHVLLWAAGLGAIDWMRFWISQGAEMEVRDSYGNTCLMLAARGGHTECVRYLLELGADVTCRHRNGCDTALSFAQLAGCWEIVSLLEAVGAR